MQQHQRWSPVPGSAPLKNPSGSHKYISGNRVGFRCTTPYPIPHTTTITRIEETIMLNEAIISTHATRIHNHYLFTNLYGLTSHDLETYSGTARPLSALDESQSWWHISMMGIMRRQDSSLLESIWTVRTRDVTSHTTIPTILSEHPVGQRGVKIPRKKNDDIDDDHDDTFIDDALQDRDRWGAMHIRIVQNDRAKISERRRRKRSESGSEITRWKKYTNRKIAFGIVNHSHDAGWQYGANGMVVSILMFGIVPWLICFLWTVLIYNQTQNKEWGKEMVD